MTPDQEHEWTNQFINDVADCEHRETYSEPNSLAISNRLWAFRDVWIDMNMPGEIYVGPMGSMKAARRFSHGTLTPVNNKRSWDHVFFVRNWPLVRMDTEGRRIQ